MAKLTLVDITSLASPSTPATLNSNSAAIETALENTLSRDGTAPNQMEADFDMNSNDILNCGNIYCTGLFIDGVEHINEGTGGGGGGEYVLKAGDTMTGNLNWQNGSDVVSIGIIAGGDMNISPDDNNHIVYINAATADAGNTGQLITGRFRSAMPIEQRNTSVVVQSGPTGVGSALVRCSSASPVSLTIRKNDGTAAADWHIGNYFSVLQEGAGAVTLAGQNGNVVLNRAATFTGNTTREQFSVITATLYSVSGGVETWVITGDLAQA